MSGLKPASMIHRLDHRKRRAEAIASAIMHEIDDFIAPISSRRVWDKIIEVLMAHGAEVLTDYDREQMGLPPRGPDGWTLDEIMAWDKRMLDAMLAPVPSMLILKEPK